MTLDTLPSEVAFANLLETLDALRDEVAHLVGASTKGVDLYYTSVNVTIARTPPDVWHALPYNHTMSSDGTIVWKTIQAREHPRATIYLFCGHTECPTLATNLVG